MKMDRNDLKIVFMGTPDIAAGIVRALKEDGYNVVLGVCQPDKPVGRKKIITPPPVKVYLEEAGIPCYQPDTLRTDDAFKTLSSYEPDLMITCAYGKILPQNILDIPKYGSLNVHASLLPKKRGAAPVQRAILDGDDVTGITVMKMDAGLDTGDMLSSVKIGIDIDMHSEELFEVMEKEGAKLLLETVMPYVNGEITPVKQNDDEATFCPPIKPEEGEFTWEDTAFAIHKKIHALSTWPGAFFMSNGKKVKIYDSSIITEGVTEEMKGAVPGTVRKQCHLWRYDLCPCQRIKGGGLFGDQDNELQDDQARGHRPCGHRCTEWQLRYHRHPDEGQR